MRVGWSPRLGVWAEPWAGCGGGALGWGCGVKPWAVVHVLKSQFVTAGIHQWRWGNRPLLDHVSDW